MIQMEMSTSSKETIRDQLSPQRGQRPKVDHTQKPAAILFTEKELAEIEAAYQAWLEGHDLSWYPISSYEGGDGYDN